MSDVADEPREVFGWSLTVYGALLTLRVRRSTILIPIRITLDRFPLRWPANALALMGNLEDAANGNT